MNSELIKAVRSLLVDIEAMQHAEDPYWFGKFSVFTSANVEWPDLAISAKKVRDLLAKSETPPSVCTEWTQDVLGAYFDDFKDLTPAEFAEFCDFVNKYHDFSYHAEEMADALDSWKELVASMGVCDE